MHFVKYADKVIGISDNQSQSYWVQKQAGAEFKRARTDGGLHG